MGIPRAHVENALILGNTMSDYRACNGKYGNPQEIASVLNLPFSEKGTAFAKQIVEVEKEQNITLTSFV